MSKERLFLPIQTPKKEEPKQAQQEKSPEEIAQDFEAWKALKKRMFADIEKEYIPPLKDEECDIHYFNLQKDKNIYRIWHDHYKDLITWTDFQKLQDFNVNNPKEGQAVKVPKLDTKQAKEVQKTEKTPVQKENTQTKPKKEPVKQKKIVTSSKDTPAKKDAYAEMDTKSSETAAFKEKKAKQTSKIEPYSPEYQKKQLYDLFDFGKENKALDDLMMKAELTVSEIKQARKLIEALKDPIQKGDYFEKLQYKVPYYNQRDSEAYPTIGGGMCNLSSMAMAFSLFGIDNPHPEMQYDDALEKLRVDNQYGDREGIGQMQIAKHFNMDFDGAGIYGYSESKKKMGGYSKTAFDRVPFIDVTDLKPSVWQNYNWFKENIGSFLKKGSSVTLGIWDKSPQNNGHIVHLVGIEPEGLRVHDPYGKLKDFSSSYSKAWDKNDTKTDSIKGKLNLWKYEDLAGKEIYLAYLRILQPKNK